MAFNLANERIQDTYEQLVQISGSTLVNGIGTAIPAITNINSVSSSYAITASYAEYAVSASHEIVHEVSSSYAETASFANFATSAGTSTSATTSTSASHALFANQAGTATTATSASHALYADQAGTATSATTSTSASHALFANQAGTATSATTATSASHALFANQAETATSATTATSASHALYADQAGTATSATTASYIDPTFISASAAASGFGGGGGATPTLQQVTDVGASTTTTLVLTDVSMSSGGDITGHTLTGLFKPNLRNFRTVGVDILTGSWGRISNIGGYTDIVAGANQIIRMVSDDGNNTIAMNNSLTQISGPSLSIISPITASIISASGGFIGDGSGLTNIPQVSQNTFYETDDYVFDLVGDTNTNPYDIHISQSGTYFLSASSTPAGVQGPRVNLYYWPELIEVGGTAKVKFFIPSGDTLAGVQYKENITGSASSEWFWPSTTSPASTTTRSIARNATFKQISVGTGGTTMTKDGNGRAFIATSTAILGTNNYLYTGDSKNPLI